MTHIEDTIAYPFGTTRFSVQKSEDTIAYQFGTTRYSIKKSEIAAGLPLEPVKFNNHSGQIRLNFLDAQERCAGTEWLKTCPFTPALDCKRSICPRHPFAAAQGRWA